MLSRVCVYPWRQQGTNGDFRPTDFPISSIHFFALGFAFQAKLFCYPGTIFSEVAKGCEFGRAFADRDGILAVNIRLIRLRSYVVLLVRPCRHCFVKNQGGCWFGLFNYDSYMSFRGIGLTRGICKLIAELGCFAHVVTPLVPAMLGINNTIRKTLFHRLHCNLSRSRVGLSSMCNLDPGTIISPCGSVFPAIC